jgi:hypothetical protein
MHDPFAVRGTVFAANLDSFKFVHHVISLGAHKDLTYVRKLKKAKYSIESASKRYFVFKR